MINREIAGQGSAVVLLHAGVCDLRMRDPQWSSLTARHRVVRVDLRGFGGTPAGPTPRGNAEDVLEVLDEAGISSARIVGASFGGLVALETAARAPERVDGLVLLSALAPGVEPTPALQAFGSEEDALVEAGDLDAATALNVRTWLGPEADEATRRRVADMQRHAFALQVEEPGTDGDGDHDGDRDEDREAEPELDLARVTAPAHVVSGGHDLDFFQAVARHLAATLPRAELVHLPWAGHLPSLERPDETTALLLDALAGDAGR